MSRASRPARSQEDGVISIIVGLSMVTFILMLAVVVDLGQVYVARSTLANAVDAAVLAAGDHLSQGGCSEYDEAEAIALDIITQHSPTATLDSFEVVFLGSGPIDDEVNCVGIVDERVARLDLLAGDQRTLVFVSGGLGQTSASASSEWGYPTQLSGGFRPLSICSNVPAVRDARIWLAQSEAYRINPILNPSPDPSLLYPFDLEVDDFDTLISDEANDADLCDRSAGRLVGVDPDGSASAAEINEMLDGGAPFVVTSLPSPDCGDGADNDAGNCEGVSQVESPDDLDTFVGLMGRTFPIAIHTTPYCADAILPGARPCFRGATGPLENPVLSASSAMRANRRYPITGIGRVRLLCTRLSSATPVGTIHSLDVTDPNYVDCSTMVFLTSDGSPGDDVMVRLEFVFDQTISEGALSSNPALYAGFLGLHLCAVDDASNCTF